MPFLEALATTAAAVAPQLMGGNGRMSHEHFMEGEARADISNARQVDRQNTFLSGVTPNMAQNYNTYQDATYAQDTARQTQRIKDMAGELGMSAWEITGAGGANPLPSPSQGETSAPQNSPAFLNSMTQLEAAKLQAKTQLATTAMNTSTQRHISDQQTAGGETAKKQAALTAAQELTEQWRHVTEQKRARLTELQALREKVETIKGLLPTEEINAGPYRRFSTTNWQRLMDATQDDVMFGNVWNGLGKDSKESMLRDLTDLVNMGFQGTKDAISGSADMFDQAGKFLADVFK